MALIARPTNGVIVRYNNDIIAKENDTAAPPSSNIWLTLFCLAVQIVVPNLYLEHSVRKPLEAIRKDLDEVEKSIDELQQSLEGLDNATKALAKTISELVAFLDGPGSINEQVSSNRFLNEN